jgi:hypothetical protein
LHDSGDFRLSRAAFLEQDQLKQGILCLDETMAAGAKTIGLNVVPV